MNLDRLLKSISILMLLNFLLPFGVIAQTSFTASDIAKIILIDEQAGMEGSGSHTYEISRQNGEWISRLTGIRSYLRINEGTDRNYDHKNLNIFVKKINGTAIKQLLLDINHNKDFGLFSKSITPAYLRANFDSLSKPDAREDYANLTNIEKEKFKQKITQATINEVISEQISAFPTDVRWDCIMKIITTNNHTIVLGTMGEGAFMLPWKINNTNTSWNANVSLFCASVMSDTVTYSNRKLLEGDGIYQNIYRSIFEKYYQATYNRDRLEKKFPQTFNMLRTVYKITDIAARDQIEDTDPMIYVAVKADALPFNVYIGCLLHPKSIDSLKMLMAYKSKAIAALKHHNFIFSYVAAHSATCSLSLNCPGSINYFSADSASCSVLQSYKQTDVISLSFNTNDNKQYSTWYLLPNGQLLLSSYSGSSVFGTPTSKFKKQPSFAGSVYIVFNAQGKLLKEY